MESIDPRKQKRLGPAPIASFEKSFEDNSQGPSPIGLTGNIRKQNMDTNCGGKNSDYDDSITTVNNKNDNNKGYELKNINPSIIKYERPKVSPPDPPQHQHPKISVSTPSKKLHDIGKKPPPLQCSSIDDRGGGVDGSNIRSGRVNLINTLGLNTPLTPRIDISRASSSSQHEDSRDSSPENVFEQVGTGTLQEAIGLGFREEGAFDLKSSTEELYFMDPEQKKEEKEKLQQARKSPIIFKFDDHQTYLQQHQRKDSASSEVAALLCISGRTSRISSVGSQGSAVSRLSAISGVSGISRSPSPHRMLLETSFCGPKPLENIVDGSHINSTEPNTSETLEHVLLSRKHDPTSVVLAEGIKIENSPKRKMLANGGAKKKTLSHEKATSADYNLIKPAPKTTGLNLSSRKTNVSSGRRGSGKQVIGVTESGTKYIRINLKPDHLYPDKGIAPNEKIIEVSSGGPGTTSISNSSSINKIQDKPSTLHINRDAGSGGSDRLTPSSSPKPARHMVLVRETGIAVPGNGGESRSPSPGNVLRKSSFCSLFKTAKDSPDSPRDRSRSKSRDLSTPQSQSGTPNKQKSVLAIFKPKRSGSKSKCSSPIDQDAITAQQLDGLAQVEFKFNSESVQEQDRSRPASRLRYYDTPLDGKSIHIPLHTPPEEKDLNKILPGHQEIKLQEQPQMSAPTPGPSRTKPTVTSPSFESASVTIIKRPESRTIMKEAPPALPVKSPKPLQLEKIQRIENLDAIQTLPQDVKEKERTWSLEVQRHSSQDSQDTVISANGSSGNNSRKPKTNLDNVIESPIKENGLIKHPQVPPPPPPKMINVQKVTVQQSQQQQQLQQQPPQSIQSNDIVSKEKKRILFATRIGSGSQEQIFSTQFSLSKTESLSSQLSEQTSIPESPAEGREAALHRSDTVIRRPEELRKKDSLDEQKVQDNNQSSVEPSKTQNSADERSRKSKSSEEEDKCPVVVMMRRKDSSEESRRKSKSASEEDDGTHRHSKYLENFDVRKQRFQDNQKRQSNNHHSSDSSIKESNSRDEPEEPPPKIPPKPIKPPPSVSPLLPPPPPASDRQSVTSTDDPAESSESERDSESSRIAMDPNRIKRHLPRHIGVIEDHESTGLVSQESFDDELPYVPTTLPEERPQGVALIPMKERAHMEMKTFSLDRPRSTTPLNPTHLEEYCGNVTPDDPNEHGLVRGEKLRISLPRKDSNIIKNQAQKSKSPRRPSNSTGKSWFEFAEQGIRGTTGGTTNTTSSTATITTPTQSGDDIQQEFKQQDDNSSPPPPPLPPRKPSSTSISSGQWINFENIPEKRKAPKRITALPKDTSVLIGQEAGNKTQEPIHYNYVKPEECQCECHEVERESNSTQKLITNVDLLQQGGGGGGEDMQPLLDSDCHEGIYPSDSSQDYDYNVDDHQSSDERRRYDIDTPSSMRNSRSNRSSGLSDDQDTSPEQISGLRSTKRSNNNSTRNQ